MVDDGGRVERAGGYRRIDGAVYALYVAAIDEVAEAEHDGFLRLFSRLPGADPEASRWVRRWMKEATMTQKLEDIPGCDDTSWPRATTRRSGRWTQRRNWSPTPACR